MAFLFATVALGACSDDSDGNCGNGALDDGEACDGMMFAEGMNACGADVTPLCTASCMLDCSGAGGSGGGTGGGGTGG